jgi:L-fuconate dehydratase
VDHLHEHFVAPFVVTNGAYRLPTEPGYSAEMFEASIDEFGFPDGRYWSGGLPV